MLATDGTWPESDSTRDDWRALERPVLISSLIVVLALGTFLCMRRLAGAATSPLAPLPLVATAIIVWIWALAFRLRLRLVPIAWLAATAIALFAVACSFPGERAIDWIVWLSVAAVYSVMPVAPARRRSPALGRVESGESGFVLQQVSRSRTAEGGSVVRGTLVAEFVPGERSATLHVAFCPPFELLPTIEAEPIEGPECSVKVEQVLHQGARFEVRLARASTTTERVTVEFAAMG